MPYDSAVNRSVNGEAATWTVTDHLLAATVDHLAAANWMFVCANSADEHDTPEPPKPVPRPGDRHEPEPGGDGEGGPDEGSGEAVPSPEQLARFFG
ncbi:hypothetical protein ACWEFL_13130 [Streptomyces sp. NPDC004838]